MTKTSQSCTPSQSALATQLGVSTVAVVSLIIFDHLIVMTLCLFLLTMMHYRFQGPTSYIQVLPKSSDFALIALAAITLPSQHNYGFTSITNDTIIADHHQAIALTIVSSFLFRFPPSLNVFGPMPVMVRLNFCLWYAIPSIYLLANSRSWLSMKNDWFSWLALSIVSLLFLYDCAAHYTTARSKAKPFVTLDAYLCQLLRWISVKSSRQFNLLQKTSFQFFHIIPIFSGIISIKNNGNAKTYLLVALTTTLVLLAFSL